MKQILISLAGAMLLTGCVTTGGNDATVAAAAPPGPQFARTADGWLIPSPKPGQVQSSAPAPNFDAPALAAAPAPATTDTPVRNVAPNPVANGVIALDPNALVYPKTGSCQSVVLFSQRPIQQPDLAVPKKWRQFLGQWGNGSWDGVVCHDLRVVDVRTDGTAEVVSMHAPYEPWGQYATAYTRNARFISEDKLLVTSSGSERLYWIDADGRMRAVRRNPAGYVTATLEKKRR
jgi:hypothetical protein